MKSSWLCFSAVSTLPPFRWHARVKLEWAKRKKKKVENIRSASVGDASVYRFIARFISLSCIPTLFWSRVSRRGTGGRGVRTLIGRSPRPFLLPFPSWGKKRASPAALWPLPSAGFLLTSSLKQIKAPSPSRALTYTARVNLNICMLIRGKFWDTRLTHWVCLTFIF